MIILLLFLTGGVMSLKLDSERLSYSHVKGARELFTPSFVKYLVDLHDRFNDAIRELRVKRAEVLDKALKRTAMPTHLPLSEINTGDWKVPLVPEDLKQPGIEISGPACITHMFINALNPGPSGQRAEGDLDDDEEMIKIALKYHKKEDISLSDRLQGMPAFMEKFNSISFHSI